MANKRSIILIIDDNEDVRRLLELILYRKHIILKAGRGESGLSLLKEHDVQVVLLDMRLPDMNGLEVLNEIKKRFPDIDVIMISAVKEVDIAERAFMLGAYTYITKTFDYDEVNSLVGECLEKRKLQRV